METAPTGLADVIRAVLAVYPEAIVEFPSTLCSVSAFPRGPEVSRRYAHAKAAWYDAFRALSRGTGHAKAKKGTRKVEAKYLVRAA
jgi:hypothetical protein